jgi:hypothetical protein
MSWAKKEHIHTQLLRGKPERKLYFTREFWDFIVFATNVFVRLSDIKALQHKHITIIQDGKNEGLEILPPSSKTVTRRTISMPSAVTVYRRLIKRHKEENKGVSAEDYVFYPEFPERQYALDNLSRLFRHILDVLELRVNAIGQKRTLYSLRHTAIMLRCLYMETKDIHLVASNALTSVKMLEKYYLSHLQPRMKIKQFQSGARSSARIQKTEPSGG